MWWLFKIVSPPQSTPAFISSCGWWAVYEYTGSFTKKGFKMPRDIFAYHITLFAQLQGKKQGAPALFRSLLSWHSGFQQFISEFARLTSPPGQLWQWRVLLRGSKSLHIYERNRLWQKIQRDKVDFGCTENWSKQGLLPVEVLLQPQGSLPLMLLAC